LAARFTDGRQGSRENKLVFDGKNPKLPVTIMNTHSIKSATIAALCLVAFLLAACSSTPTTANRGSIHARSFSFVQLKPGAADFAEKRQAVHGMVQEAIVNNLARKGVSHFASGGDVTVAYLLVVGNNASTMAVNDYFGYGRDTAALTDKAQEAYNSSKNPNYFEAGTLLIDVLDPKSGQLLWRSHVTKPLLQNVTDEARAQRIQEAVNETLSGLQIQTY
jgi:hypothetical protein